MRNMLICLVSVAICCGCGPDSDSMYHDLADVADKRLAVLDGVLGDSLAKACFPDAELKDYDKVLNIFLDMEAGKCDAIVMDVAIAEKVLSVNPDYACLGRLEKNASGGGGEEIVVLVANRMYAPSMEDEAGYADVYGKWSNRFYRNVLADDSWHLITGGLYTTVVIFVGAAVFAFILAVLLTYMGINHKWPWLYTPLHWFVFTIHDIPSVVLMMFFYYVVFASSSMSGVFVAAIALGVYSSASLTKIFKIHVCQISKEQREAGLMLGLTTRQVYRYIVFPQAVRTMLPLVVAEMKLLLRSTSYAGYIAQKDLVKAVDAIRGLTYDAFFPLLIVSLLYLLLSWMIAKALQEVAKKMFVYD